MHRIFRSVGTRFTLLTAPRFYSQILREAAAEFAGVMILVIFGNGVVCQVVLSGNPAVVATPKGVSNLTGHPGNIALIVM